MNRIHSCFGVCCLFTCLAYLTGCGAPTEPNVVNKPARPEAAGHDHPSHGPHEGHLIELGEEEYHAELAHDDETHTVTIYLLDSKAKAAVPIAEPSLTLNLVSAGKPTQVTLLAAPLPGEPAGQSSRFQLVDEKTCELVCSEDSTGRLNVTIGGKPYIGNIAHHDHEGHEHGKK